MLYKIEGFNQKNAIEFKDTIDGKEVKLDCTDLVLLRWFALRYSNVDKKEIDDKKYIWVNYSSVLDDLPILNMKKVQLSRRFNKLVHFKILDFKLYKVGGTFTYYTYGINYKSLVETVENSKDSCTPNDNGYTKKYNGINKNVEAVCTEMYNPSKQKCLNKTYNTITYNTNTYNTSSYKRDDENFKTVEKLKSQIEYDRLIEEACEDEKIKRIIQMMLSMMIGCNKSNKPYITMSGKNIPIAEVRQKLNAMNYKTCNAVIDKVLDSNGIRNYNKFVLWAMLNVDELDYDADETEHRINTLSEDADIQEYVDLLNTPGGINE